MNVKASRTEGALLAGVCAGIAQAFNWNVWVLRALFVAFLLIKTLWAIVVYAVLALVFKLFEDQWPGKSKSGEGLASPELSERNQRISDLEVANWLWGETTLGKVLVAIRDASMESEEPSLKRLAPTAMVPYHQRHRTQHG